MTEYLLRQLAQERLATLHREAAAARSAAAPRVRRLPAVFRRSSL